ncbi:ATP-grasp domain-containing protein [Nesterenkonia pannonica]|uniref:ATP-grasp domain-containing protein n=1 Tax=Nesterenkonia pannonica TaxID=1548602 RepID=UPI0021646F23|nr:ATP-grasp domain-containing protein [Nesterenkonia pannonica]
MLEQGIKAGLTTTLLANRAMEKGVPIFADHRNRLIMKVSNRRVRFEGAHSNLNDRLARRCTRYKDVTTRLLLNEGVRAPENVAFRRDQLHEAWSWASHQIPVVVKPHNGRMGASVHIGITEFADFEKAFHDVADQSEYVLVERFVDGVEHRVLLISGKVAAAARRVPANVIGDGTSTVTELVDEKNRLRTESQNPVHYQILVDDIVVKELEKQQLELESVPEDGQQVWLRPNSNVHSGGDGVDATDELTEEEIALAESVAQAIPGLRVAGIDMLLPRNGNGEKPYVLEVNSNAMITGHHYPWVGQSRDVASMLIDAMFADASAGEKAPLREADPATVQLTPTTHRSCARRPVHFGADCRGRSLLSPSSRADPMRRLRRPHPAAPSAVPDPAGSLRRPARTPHQ